MKTPTVFLLAGLALAQSQGDNEANTTSIDSIEAVSVPSERSNEPPSSKLVAAGNSGLANILPKSLFKQIFPNALPIYTYENLLANAAKYPGFANSGNSDVDRREVAASLGQVALETGNLQYLSWNYNYKDFGNTVGKNLVANPGLVASDGNLVWLSAMWFWNTDRGSGNIHNVVGQPGGFAKATNIINGALECGLHPSNPDSEKVRIAGFRTYCKLLRVSPGNNLSCQTAAFGKTSLTESPAKSNEKQVLSSPACTTSYRSRDGGS
ncbi:Chitinase 1 [Aphanomyces cochlioides]|nr:Chitinase 1 [Aphanomyces cochlioides]